MVSKNDKTDKLDTSKIDDKLIKTGFNFIRSRQNYGVWEQRVIWRIICSKDIQAEIKTIIDNKDYKRHPNFTVFPNTVECEMPLSDFTEDTANYKMVKNALANLAVKVFAVEEDKNVWKQYTFLAFPKIDKNTGIASFAMDKDVCKSIVDLIKGYRLVDIPILFKITGKYAWRLYTMIYNQDKTNDGFFDWKIEDFIDTFQLSDSYRTSKGKNNIKTKILNPAKEELDEKANFSFEYEFVKNRFTKVFDTIRFHVIYKPENEVKDNIKEQNIKRLESKENNLIDRYYPPISEELKEILTKELQLSEKEINSSKAHFQKAEFVCKKTLGNGYINLLADELFELKEKGLKKEDKNWKAYVIGCLKKDDIFKDIVNKLKTKVQK